MSKQARSIAQGRWEHFSHQADVGIRGYGPTLSDAFAQAAKALVAVVCDPDTVSADTAVEVACAVSDRELLLVDWLNAVIFEMATRKMLFAEFDVSVEDGDLRARLRGEAVDVRRHQPAVEVKGATYTQLRVVKSGTGEWMAQCVVDV